MLEVSQQSFGCLVCVQILFNFGLVALPHSQVLPRLRVPSFSKKVNKAMETMAAVSTDIELVPEVEDLNDIIINPGSSDVSVNTYDWLLFWWFVIRCNISRAKCRTFKLLKRRMLGDHPLTLTEKWTGQILLSFIRTTRSGSPYIIEN